MFQRRIAPAGVKARTADEPPASLARPLPDGILSHYGIVQHKLSIGGAGPEAVQSAAQRGVQGSAHALPHLDAVQQSFGRHDVGSIRAHSDGRAAAACHDMGAEAYASGGSVAFSGAPSLHTAAHEAAHVVQQRGGVHLKGGVGAAGDLYEQHADEVADRVVRGQSAEALLDRHAGGGGAGVQRKIVFDDSKITYGPGDAPLDQLFKELEAHGARLDKSQMQKLEKQYGEGESHYGSLDALLESCFGMLGGLHAREKHDLDGETARDQQGAEWYVSGNTRGFDDISPQLEHAAQELKLQLAACGGEIYRLMLGAPQPKVLTAVCEDKPVRASQAVPGRMAWPVHGGQEDKQGSGFAMLESGKVMAMNGGQQVSIDGLLQVFVTAMFLGDVDVNDDNLSAVLEAQQAKLRAVKIDPETSFSGFFFQTDHLALGKALHNPTLAEDHNINHAFADNICNSLAASDTKILALLHSASAMAEKYGAIKTLLTCDPSALFAVVDRCVSDVYGEVKELVKKGLLTRIETLRKAALLLPGYPQFHANGVLPQAQSPSQLMTAEMRESYKEDSDEEEGNEEQGRERSDSSSSEEDEEKVKQDKKKVKTDD